MQKLTLTDFTGGLQELTAAEDFSARQWSILKGFVFKNSEVVETQWPVQTIGTGASNTNMQAVFPLGCEKGMFLVAIKTDGTLWWCPAPAHNAAYGTANAVTWSQITAAENRGLYQGATTTQSYETLVANPELRFICAVPLRAFNYIREPQGDETATNGPAADLDNPSKDREVDAYSEAALFSAVLLNTAEKTSNTKHNQQVVLFVDTNQTPAQVKAITFPNFRRLPMREHKDANGVQSNDFILAAFINDDGGVEVDTFPTWPTNMVAAGAPEVKMHPYTYVDIDDTLLPGRGIIPRANVGCMKGDKIILGDIEWLSNFNFRRPTLEDYTLPVSVTAATAVKVELKTVEYRTGLNGREAKTYGATTMGGTIYNGGETTVYFGPTTAAIGTAFNVKNRSRYKDWPGPFNLITVAGLPGAGDGVDGDYAQDSITGNLYGPKASGTWPAAVLPKTSGTALPTTTGPEAINNNYYIHTSASDVYGPFRDVVKLVLTTAPVGITVGDNIKVVGVGKNLDGTFPVIGVESASTPYYVEYARKGKELAVKPARSGKVYDVTQNFYLRANPGETVSIPHDWDEVWAVSDGGTNAGLVQKFNVDIAYHFLNDDNTKPYRQSFYFSHSELDEFDPRSMVSVGKTDVRIAGLHTIDDTIIAITSAGGEEDGVYRVTGYLTALNPYDGSAPNQNAVRVQLIRGGVGAPTRITTGGHKSYSCLWRSANSVVFIDRLGGIWYTNGRLCDRLDRSGPRTPSVGLEEDHVADVGEYLFVFRDSRLLCFSLLSSDGDSGVGAWTELIKPAGGIKSMIGGREDLYFINGGKVMRYATAGPDAERGRIDNVVQTLTLGTPTIPSQNEHDRTNWQYFGMTFSTPSSCTVGTVQVQSTGALNTVGGVTAPTVAHTVTLNRSFSSAQTLGEFMVPAGISQQNAISATVTFTGHVRLETASFLFAGRQPRRGDQ